MCSQDLHSFFMSRPYMLSCIFESIGYITTSRNSFCEVLMFLTFQCIWQALDDPDRSILKAHQLGANISVIINKRKHSRSTTAKSPTEHYHVIIVVF